jgi:hypothetical protein
VPVSSYCILSILKRENRDIFQKISNFSLDIKFIPMKKYIILTLSMISLTTTAQEVMTPELLWKLGRVSPIGISKDGKNIVYKVSTPSVEENKSNSKYYSIPISGGKAIELEEQKS